MNIIELLSQQEPLLPPQQATVDQQLSSAYNLDEAAAKSQSIERIASKVHERLQENSSKEVAEPNQRDSAYEEKV